MTKEQLFKRNSLLAKELRDNHRGSGNPLSSEQASKFLVNTAFILQRKTLAD